MKVMNIFSTPSIDKQQKIPFISYRLFVGGFLSNVDSVQMIFVLRSNLFSPLQVRMAISERSSSKAFAEYSDQRSMLAQGLISSRE